jgi:hypothetical protein
MVEYVGISEAEKIYGTRVLLQSQLDSINASQRFDRYKKLREEELVLKVNVKAKVDEILDLLVKLERSLPKADFSFLEARKEVKGLAKARKPSVLLGEAADIRRKLERLQGI